MILAPLVRTAATLTLSGVALSAAAATLPLLRITDLSAATGLQGSRVVDINNAGEVLGYQSLRPAYLWRPGAPVQLIQAPAGKTLGVRALNDVGTVVGRLNFPGGSQPFTWDSARGLVPMHLPNGVQNGSADAVNRRGRAAGSAAAWNGSDWRAHMIVGSARLGMVDPMAGEHGGANARAINNLDHVGGASTKPAGCCYSAVLVGKHGHVEWLGKLGAADEDDYSIVQALNDNDVAVGYSNAYPGATPHAFYWSRATGMLPLPVGLGSSEFSMATGINRHDQVVGSYSHGGTSSSFYWDAEHGAVDLQDRLDPADPLTPVTRLADSGVRINDSGQIVVNAVIGGVATAVLLTPAP